MIRKAIKPKASRISDWGYQVLYVCGSCGYKFDLADSDGYDYCPHCGSKIDWGVIWGVNEEWRSRYISADYDDRRELCAELDKLNKKITDGEKREMEYTLATQKAITRSNIEYYLSRGASKETLIKNGFFTKEDFVEAGL